MPFELGFHGGTARCRREIAARPRVKPAAAAAPKRSISGRSVNRWPRLAAKRGIMLPWRFLLFWNRSAEPPSLRGASDEAIQRPRAELDCFAFARNDDKRICSRDASAPEFCFKLHERLPRNAIPVGGHRFLAQGRKKEAERRQARSPSSAPAGAARVQRDALTCRRSTTALAAANQRHSSAPERASWEAAKKAGVTRPRLSQSSDCTSQTGRHAGRALFPKPPGSGGDEPPPAGTALAPSAGVAGRRPLRERDFRHVTEMGTYVNKIVTTLSPRHCRA